MDEDDEEEVKLHIFLQTSMLMRDTALWLEEYAVFGDGLDSDLEYQDHPQQ